MKSNNDASEKKDSAPKSSSNNTQIPPNYCWEWVGAVNNYTPGKGLCSILMPMHIGNGHGLVMSMGQIYANWPELVFKMYP